MTAVAQRSFAGGELAPSLYARTDQSKYATGLRTCRNMMVQRHGGVTNRTGTPFVAEVKDSTKVVRLIPFEHSDTSNYVLEFGDLYMRLHKNGAPLKLGAAPSGWVFPFFYFAGDAVSSAGINYINITGTNPNIAPAANPTAWYPLTGLIIEIPTPFLAVDLAQIRYAQSVGLMTFAHPSYAPRQLRRNSEESWSMTTMSFGASIGPPTGPGLAGGAAGAILYWAITAILAETFEESAPVLVSAINRVPSGGTPTTVSWTGPVSPTAAYYRVFRSSDGVTYGFIGQTSSISFSDVGSVPDLLQRPPEPRDIFNAANKYPTAVTHYQQRLAFGNTNLLPETVWASRTGQLTNFTKRFPLQDDDAVTFTMVGRRLSSVKHLLDLGRLIIFAQAEEKMAEGDQSGILRPDAVNPRKLSANGSGTLRPLEIDDSAIYIQARGTIIRDFKPVSADSYQGTDLTVFAAHLFNGYSIVDWDYAQNPHSIVWVARNDGVLLGLTYLRDHDIWGWHHHDTDGVVENVCVVPEGAEDLVYLVVKRTINGVAKRYIERMASRFFVDQEDAIFVDCGITYDGWNVAATTMTLSLGVAWDDQELLTMTASVAVFAAADVGNVVILRILNSAGVETDRIRFTISSFTSTTVVKGHADKLVPAGLRTTAKTTWALAKKTITGLAHLEGKAVAALGDGFVAASPNNAQYPTVVVAGGSATFDTPYAVMQIGLPYISDVVTLDLDNPGPATIKDRKILVNRLGIYIEGSRGIWAGMPDQPTAALPLNGLQEYKARSEEDYSSPVSPKTDFIEINIEARWDANGRQMIRQVDPLPLTVLSITPIGYLS